MRTPITRRGARGLVELVVAVAAVVVIGVAFGDTIEADADVLTAGDQASKNLGTVAPGAVLTPKASFKLTCAGKAHVDQGQTVNLTYTSSGSTVPAGGTLSATSASIGAIPASWPDDTTGGGSTNCPDPVPALDDNGDSTVTITAPTVPATYTFIAKWDVSISPTGNGDPNAITGPAPTAAFTLTVQAPPSDTTPPVITPNISGTLGNNGWYTSDVTVTWTVSDPESAILSSTECGTTTINTDTGGQTLTCSATSAGGTNSQSVTIKRDASAPTVSVDSVKNADNSTYTPGTWTNQDVTVDFSCTDNGPSGVASLTPDPVTKGEGENQTASTTCTDNAGNTANGSVSDIDVDKTKPVVTVTGVANGATYVLGSVPVAGCDTTDALSGVKTAASLSSSGGPVGFITASCTGAEDNAGNTNSASVTYSVIYDFHGFFRPVDNGNVFNVVKAGQGVPMKFDLSGYQGMNIFVSGYPKSIKINCISSADQDNIEETVAAGSSSLNYDGTVNPPYGQYNYVWKTDKAWAGTCRQFQMMLSDGTTKTANFNFTK